MTTTEALRAHRLVTARWRVIRYDGTSAWIAQPVDHQCGQECPCAAFETVREALDWAQRGVTP